MISIFEIKNLGNLKSKMHQKRLLKTQNSISYQVCPNFVVLDALSSQFMLIEH